MNVLVTGGAGYIGSHTVLELLNDGFGVIVADNLCNASEEGLRRVEKITGKKAAFYPVDVRDREAMRNIFTEHKIDWVIHFAGLKAVGESVAKPIEYYDNNLISTLVLLEVMREFGVKNLIFSSSATVYGDPERLPLDEECSLSTTNPYGTTKLMQENILKDPKGIPNNLMPYVAQVATGKLQKIGVFGNDYPTPDGTGVRDYIHVVDLARGHVAAIKGLKTAGVHIYNLGTGNGYSVLDMIRAFSKACGKELPYEPRRKKSSAGRRSMIWKKCAPISGIGRKIILTDTKNNFCEVLCVT